MCLFVCVHVCVRVCVGEKISVRIYIYIYIYIYREREREREISTFVCIIRLFIHTHVSECNEYALHDVVPFKQQDTFLEGHWSLVCDVAK